MAAEELPLAAGPATLQTENVEDGDQRRRVCLIFEMIQVRKK